MTRRSTSLSQRVRGFVNRYRPLPKVYGHEFESVYAFLTHSSTWTTEQLLDYKLAELRKLVAYAQQHVPFYRESFNRAGVEAGDITSLEAFAQLPVLEVEDLLDRPDMLKSDEFDTFAPYPTRTSGTTGQCKELWRSAYQEAFRQAVVWRIHERFGLHFRDPAVLLEVPHPGREHAPLYDHDRIENVIDLNSHFILRGQFREVVAVLRSSRPRMIKGLTNLLVMIAEYVVERELPQLETPLVVIMGEKIYPHTLALLQGAFSGTVIDYFGNRENTIAAWGLAGEPFIEFSEYCHLEPLDPTTPSDVLTTCLHNFAMPLIRYRVGDVIDAYRVRPELDPRPSFDLLGGRGKDLLLTRDGLRTSFVLLYYEDQQFDKFSLVQVVQRSLDEVTIRVIPRPSYNRERDEARAIAIAEAGLGNKFRVGIEYLTEVPRTPEGKYRPVISELAVKHIQQQSGRVTS